MELRLNEIEIPLYYFYIIYYEFQALESYIGVCAQSQNMLQSSSSLESTDECLAMMTGFLHPDHYLYTKAAKRAFEGHLVKGNHAKAREYGLLCLNSYRKYKVSGGF